MKISRNDSCPCQSGKKYKKCCLVAAQEESNSQLQSLLRNPKDEYLRDTVNPEVFDECADVINKLEITGNIAKAWTAAHRLHELHPNHYMVHYLYGACFTKEKKHAEAIYYFEKAVQIYPLFAQAYYNLGIAYTKEIKLPDAIESFRQAVKIEGKNGYIGRLAQQEIDSLASIIKTCNGLSLDDYIKNCFLFDQSVVYLRNKKYEEAIPLFNQVLVMEPDHVQSYGNLGIAYSAIGKNKLALECLNKALSIDPSYEPARLNRTIISRLNDGEKLNGISGEVLYYKDGMGDLAP